MTVYFDNASTMQVFPAVKKYLLQNAGHLNADRNVYHQAGVKTAAEIEKSRITIANTLNISPANIKFLCDEAFLFNMISNYLQKFSFKSIISYKDENPLLLQIFKNIAEKQNIKLHFVEQTEDSGIDLKQLKYLLKQSQKTFVALPHVNAVTGRLLSIRRVSELCQKHNAIFYCDISHSIGRFDLDLSQIPVDIASFESHKTAAIHGLTALFVKRGNLYRDLHKDIFFRENQNAYAIASLRTALETWNTKAKEFNQKVKELKKYLFEKLKQANIDYKSISESEIHFSPYLINISFKVSDFEAFCYKLDLNNVQIKPFFDDKQILVSFNPMNNTNEIDRFVEICKQAIL